MNFHEKVAEPLSAAKLVVTNRTVEKAKNRIVFVGLFLNSEAIGFSTGLIVIIALYSQRLLQNAPFYPIPASGSNFARSEAFQR